MACSRRSDRRVRHEVIEQGKIKQRKNKTKQGGRQGEGDRKGLSPLPTPPPRCFPCSHLFVISEHLEQAIAKTSFSLQFHGEVLSLFFYSDDAIRIITA